MKNIIVAILASVAITASAAETINGLDSLSIGNLAGKGGSANRTVVIGSGSGAYMTGCDSNLFVGAASGLRTKDVTSTVAIGHYAARGATNCQSCVFIGDLSGKCAENVQNSVLIGPLASFGMDKYAWTDVNGLIRGNSYQIGMIENRNIQFGAPWNNMTDNNGTTFNEAVSGVQSVKISIEEGPMNNAWFKLVIKWTGNDGQQKTAKIPLEDYMQ